MYKLIPYKRKAGEFQLANTETGKKLVHLLFNPFEKWNILMPLRFYV